MAWEFVRQHSQHRRGQPPLLVRTRPRVEFETTEEEPLVTIKRLANADGATVWEYGPGFCWAPHKGGSIITGLVPDVAGFSKDAFCVVPSVPQAHFVGNTYIAAGGGTVPNRNTTTIAANCSEAITITSLLETDGTVSASATLDGAFVTAVEATTVTFLQFQFLTSFAGEHGWAGLSGGGWAILGQRLPLLQLNDYTSNPTTKSYTLHAHTQSAGNCRLTTRTSGHTISFAWNASAAAIKAAIESSSDVVSATVTGGPWPHRKYAVSVVWNSSVDDFATWEIDGLYTAGPASLPTQGAVTVYDPATGLISNSAGWQFGGGNGVSETWLISQTTPISTTPDPPSGQVINIVAGDSDRVALVSQPPTSGSPRWLEIWTTGSTWTRNAVYRINHTDNGSLMHVASNTLGLSWSKRTYNSPSKTRNGVTIPIGSPSVTEIDDAEAVAYPGNGLWQMQNGAPASRTLYWLMFHYTEADYPSIGFPYCNDGEETKLPSGNKLLLGRGLVGTSSLNFECDGTSIACYMAQPSTLINYGPPKRNPTSIGGTSAKAYYWKFFTIPQQPLETGTEFRFRFNGGGLGIRWSAWLDWHVSAADLKTALLAVFPENTEGVTSNITVNPFGAPPALLTSLSLIEQNLEILFAGATGASYVPPAFVNNVGDVTIELRNLTPRYTPGICLIDQATGAQTWSREFGTTADGLTRAPDRLWLKGGDVYCYGSVVAPDL